MSCSIRHGNRVRVAGRWVKPRPYARADARGLRRRRNAIIRRIKGRVAGTPTDELR